MGRNIWFFIWSLLMLSVCSIVFLYGDNILSSYSLNIYVIHFIAFSLLLLFYLILRNIAEKRIGISNSDRRVGFFSFKGKSDNVLDQESSNMQGFLNFLTAGSKVKSVDSKQNNREEIYRAIFENTGTATVILEKSALISLSNDKFSELTGYSREEIEGKKYWTEFVPDEELKRMRKYHDNRRIKDDIPKSYEFKFIDRYSNVKDILLTVDVIPGTTKSVASLLDVTEQKTAELKIKQLNGTLHAIRNVNKLITKERNVEVLIKGVCDFLIENRNYSNVWVVLLDSEGKKTFSAEAGIGKSFKLLDEMFKKGETTESAKEALCNSSVVCVEDPSTECKDCPLANIYKGRSAMSVKLEYKGTVYGILSVSVPKEILKSSEEKELFKGVASDIAFAIYRINLENKEKNAVKALQESEDRFKKLSTFSFEGILIHDKGVVMEVNSSFERLLGYSRGELLNKNILEMVIPKNYYPLVMENISKDIAKPYEVKLSRKDGSLVDVEIESRDVLYDNNEIRVSAIRDISERKLAENKLRISEYRFRQIYDNLTVGVARISMNYVIESANHAYCSMLGYSEEELIGMTLKDITHPEVIEENMKKQSQLASGEISHFSMEKRFIHKNGSIRYGILEACIIKGANDNEDYFLGTVVDITDRKYAERELQESEEKFRILAQTSPMAILLHQNGKMVYANSAAMELCEYDFSELSDKYLWEIISPEFKDEVKRKGEENDKSREAVENYEIKFITKSGKEKWVIVNGNSIWLNGEYSRIITILDITERKRAEIVQDIIHNISNSIIITDDINEFISTVKDQLERIIDCSNFYVTLFNEDTDKLNMVYHVNEKDDFSYMPMGDNITSFVFRSGKLLKVTDKEIREMEGRGEIVIVGSVPKVWLGLPLIVKGKVIGVMALQSYKDISYSDQDVNILEIISHQVSLSIEKKRAEYELKNALEKALESERLKSAFLANMSHEIRTPMNSILGFMELLGDQDLTEAEKKEYISIIQRNSDRLLTTINDIIDISRIEAGQVNLSIKMMSLNKVMEELYSSFNLEARKKGIDLIMKTGLPLGKEIIETDESKLHAVMTNLIKNAIKFTESGSITYGYEFKDKVLEFYVCDTGIGIPEDRREAVFNRFEQADVNSLNSNQGSGLGLAISKAYVEMLGGKIGLSSGNTGGSTFKFTIPY